MNLTKFFEQDKKLLIKVIAGVILLVIAFAFYLMKENTSDGEMELSMIPEDTEIGSNHQLTNAAIDEKIMILVDVAGAVVRPSVVELTEGSRIFEAIEKAGGLTGEADMRGTNQAEVLMDGQKVYIPTKQEVQDIREGSTTSIFSFQEESGRSGLININTADSETLQQLSGIGPVTADKIINYRNENGKFKSIEDIKNVNGIGDKTFEKFKSKITV